jgi:hypothetical protein
MFKVPINPVNINQSYKDVVKLSDVLKHGAHVLDAFVVAVIIRMLLSNKGIKDYYLSTLYDLFFKI